jgi:hypothetical protein
MQTSNTDTLALTVVTFLPDSQYSRLDPDKDPLNSRAFSLLTYEAPPSASPGST